MDIDPDDSVWVEYDDFLERFGRDDVIIFAIQPAEVFAVSGLASRVSSRKSRH